MAASPGGSPVKAAVGWGMAGASLLTAGSGVQSRGCCHWKSQPSTVPESASSPCFLCLQLGGTSLPRGCDKPSTESELVRGAALAFPQLHRRPPTQSFRLRVLHQCDCRLCRLEPIERGHISSECHLSNFITRPFYFSLASPFPSPPQSQRFPRPGHTLCSDVTPRHPVGAGGHG